MTRKVFNMNGGRHSQAALSAFINALYGTSVASGLNVTAFSGTGLKVVVKAGTGNIDTGLGYGHMVQADADETITLAAASPSLPRNSLIVGYIDKSVAPTTTVVDNINNIFKIKEIAGTPAASPQDPPASVIQSAVGATSPYIILGRVRVGANATSLAQSMITDMRKLVGLPFSGEYIADASIEGNKLAKATVKANNIDMKTLFAAKNHNSTVTVGNVMVQSGWTQFFGDGSNTIRVPLTFPKQFDQIYSITSSFNGYKFGDAATNLSQFGTPVGAGNYVEPVSVNVSGCTLIATSRNNFGGAWHGISWTAVGEV